MAGKYSVKETKELISGVCKTSIVLYSQFRDGVQVADFGGLLNIIQGRPDLQQALLDAYNGADDIPAEMGELDLVDSLELAKHAASEGIELAKAIIEEQNKPLQPEVI